MSSSSIAQRNRDAFCRRYEQDGVRAMSKRQFWIWVNTLPSEEFFAMVDLRHPVRRPIRNRNRRVVARVREKPAPTNSDALCKALVCIAAFNLNDNPTAQLKVYEAVRTLQLLDQQAVAAGLLSRQAPPSSSEGGR